MEFETSKLLEQAEHLIIAYAVVLVEAAAILIFGWIVINWIVNKVKHKLKNKTDNHELLDFVSNTVNFLLKIVLILAVISKLGIETTSIIALLGSAGLAVGLALQGSLSNIAGGLIILILRPFRKGHFIEAQGQMGEVIEIGLFTTIIASPENRKVIIPNAPLSNGIITNYTERGTVRCDISIGIAYDANIGEAKKVLLDVISNHPNSLDEPAPTVIVSQLADSSVNLIARVFTKVEHLWPTFFDLNEKCKIALDEANIEIPFPQRVIHMKKEE
ncbi:mechanosensitive ion channel family protein [Sediminitomix flava]|uniref:Small conductance mechanosensitive channel n=1 Tax=Sediminitomix flava TaxID=379075 RepID=A0A315ZDL7_SEDFL|nr:mechanosensitive ion channel domain-containing protein [Sediminitomix flava]PWJ43706.1 small conductance mechanosensitive channel [Sediminitomix flava]